MERSRRGFGAKTYTTSVHRARKKEGLGRGRSEEIRFLLSLSVSFTHKKKLENDKEMCGSVL
jgi:hypothetical protein